jgi:hypothetical protein
VRQQSVVSYSDGGTAPCEPGTPLSVRAPRGMRDKPAADCDPEPAGSQVIAQLEDEGPSCSSSIPGSQCVGCD